MLGYRALLHAICEGRSAWCNIHNMLLAAKVYGFVKTELEALLSFQL